MKSNYNCIWRNSIPQKFREINVNYIKFYFHEKCLRYRFLVFPPIFFSFYRAQFQENRSIFNTPNPRLMNVSLLKDSKSYHKYSTSSTSKAGSSGSRNRSMRLSSVSSAGGIPKNASSQHQNFSTPISSSEFDRNTSSLHYAPETFKM